MTKQQDAKQIDLFEEAKADLPLSAPYARGSDTSKAAAESIEPASGTLRARVLGTIKSMREYGMTCDEVEQTTHLTHQTASARVHELHKLGAIRDSGRRRNTRSGRKATVWVDQEHATDGKVDQHPGAESGESPLGH